MLHVAISMFPEQLATRACSPFVKDFMTVNTRAIRFRQKAPRSVTCEHAAKSARADCCMRAVQDVLIQCKQQGSGGLCSDGPTITEPVTVLAICV